MLCLGIESSCDETAVAVVRDGREVLCNRVFSQVGQHAAFGGVVPEVAARSHLDVLADLIQSAMVEAGIGWPDVDAIAATRGPGLASSLLIGFAAAKALALVTGKPLIPVNHLEAHLYSVFLDQPGLDAGGLCPMLTLLVSGGNTCLVRVDGVGRYRVLGQTLDDAAGEALDKGAVLLGLGYPGGPAIERAARGGDPSFKRFPRGLEQDRPPTGTAGLARDLCFSFSGLKTSLLYYLRRHPDAVDAHRADLAASFQEAVFDALLLRMERGLAATGVRTLALVGGVARNRCLRDKLDRLVRQAGIRLLLAPPHYCTDNAAMIAGLAGALPIPDQAGIFATDVDPGLPISAGVDRKSVV